MSIETKTTQAIPFFNILWAEISDFDVTIQYVKHISKHRVRVAAVNYLIDKPQQSHAQAWITRLLDHAYGGSRRRKRIKVLINPFGGQGKAQKWFLRDIEPIFAAARCEVDVEKTAYRGHATEIAEKLDTDAFDVVASCSGDGLPHEVFNGLAMQKDAVAALSKVAVVQLPCGTGNAMSWNCFGTDSNGLAALGIVKGIRIPLDLVSITQGQTRTLSFLSQSVGIVAEVDLGTENIRWMGNARFTYGFLTRILRKTVWPCQIHVKIEQPSKADVKDHFRREAVNRPRTADRGYRSRNDALDHDVGQLPPLRYGTVNSPIPESFVSIPGERLGNFYSGNMALMAPGMNFFPATLPSDGCADLITIDGDISRLPAIKAMLAVENGTFFDMPYVNYRKVSGYRIKPLKLEGREGYIAIDGERYPYAEFQAEVHQGLGTTLSKSGRAYEAATVVPIS